ncbi:scarecrow-like protein 33 [Cornus florida]|uniref:scarecrow-like protein 33 n=1 Tax=Cornus florida TaxID=4283 RepID=UPI00289D678B|nr:scarecrow-like protein 33 [Cornus florida]
MTASLPLLIDRSLLYVSNHLSLLSQFFSLHSQFSSYTIRIELIEGDFLFGRFDIQLGLNLFRVIMDPHFSDWADWINDHKFDGETVLPGFDQSQNLADRFKLKDDSLDFGFMDIPFLPSAQDPGNFAPSSLSSEVESPGDHDLSDTILKNINQILMEENMDEKPSVFHDPLALRAAEKSLYEIIGEKYPSSPDQPSFNFNQDVESPDDHFFGRFSEHSSTSGASAGNSIDTQWIVDRDYMSSVTQRHLSENNFQSNLQPSSQWSSGSINSIINNYNAPVDSSVGTQLVSNEFSDSESVLQFKRGVEEASKFLPSANQLIINLENYSLPPKSIQEAREVVVKVEKDEKEYSPNGSRARKNHHREDGEIEEERSSKQLAVYVEEVELSERFDRVLLFTNGKGELAYCTIPFEEMMNGKSKALQQNRKLHKSKKQASKNGGVDLKTLLINCAQSVAADDRRTAYEQLKQIRRHASSSSGDGIQRLAHIFANGLEARLAGTGFQIYATLGSKRVIAAEKLKAYQLYLSACPFKKMSIFYADKTILNLASVSTRRTLHVVDFGILYGFQWPVLIQHLPTVPGGAPKLRITGIEFPQPGFRPSELIEKTGRHLAKYCERFNVPFEYNAIAQKWETIKIEDLKIDSNELLAVNCLFRFENLLDDTVVVDSPRDAVLKLIRKMNPDIFVHSVFNGSYNAPFFLTRFRLALSHYSAWFDVFDTTINCEDQEWLNFEKEFYGREVMNVIACEGLQRVERPESYKQWQVRNMRAGFRPLPLNKTIVNNLRGKMKAGGYHKEFVIDEDSHWMLQGWKGRILCASSCWVPQ